VSAPVVDPGRRPPQLSLAAVSDTACHGVLLHQVLRALQTSAYLSTSCSAVRDRVITTACCGPELRGQSVSYDS